MEIKCLRKVQRIANRLVSGIQMYPYREGLLLPKLYLLDINYCHGDLMQTSCLFAENQGSSFFTLVGESSLHDPDKEI